MNRSTQLLSLTKPGIIFGNLITVSGGFFLASHGHPVLSLYLATLVGIALIIASGCVFNNMVDRDIDQLMARTKHRLSATGAVSVRVMWVYAAILGIVGAVVLYTQAHWLSMVLGLVGLVFYVGGYTLWFKRKSIYGTLVGSISGAMPPIVGYCAVVHRIDLGAVILFAMLVLWQMPHSYAIAIYRLHDYQAAGIPVLPVKVGIPRTKVSMLWYTIAFAIVSTLLTTFGYTGNAYGVVSTLLGIGWTWLVAQGFGAKKSDTVVWARKVFIFSIVIIMLLSILMSVDVITT